MNYRHAFHAGNFADVLKHAVLTRILVHLRGKPAPFRVIDIHAGAGRYDLTVEEAQRSGEWRDGIARLAGASLRAPARVILAPYLDAVAACNPAGRLIIYPGSPWLARALLRAQDRLIACELEPNAATALAHNLKWASGTYLVWYPIKERTAPDALARRLRNSGIPKILRAELSVSAREPGRLAACGLVVVNPPWTLARELAILLPELAAVLSAAAGGAHRLDWLTGES